jgi:L-Lysine epsilon oxidase N-terminal/L-lysine epsilon oxidase C-terminal domain
MPTTYEVFPPIGIARLGTSTTNFFVGPDPEVPPPAQYRDATGNLKRQAARFRVFRCDRDANGRLAAAAELAPGDGQITWTAHLVNRKAASPRFVANGLANSDPHLRRNNATGDDAQDRDLIIDPGPRTVSAAAPRAAFDNGKRGSVTVPLGEARIEAGTGRLLILGGFGTSAAVDGSSISGFAENDGWFDDVSDGPVSAAVVLTDRSSPPVKPAWVVVAPPDFAPGVTNLVSLYDTLYAQAISRGFAARTVIPAPPAVPSYPDHVLPILLRVLGYQWVNAYARQGHGPGGPGDFTSTADWPDLGDPAADGSLRRQILALLRDPAAANPSTASRAMPRLFSDDYPRRTTLPLTPVQYAILKAWADGQFTAAAAPPVGAELLPDALTRIALEACVGGAFWPGIEAGRVFRDLGKFLADEPYRLSPVTLRSGELTGSMALPWQADFFDCAWEGTSKAGQGWWPAQRPDDVMTAAGSVEPWARGIASKADLIANWSQLGVVVDVGGGAKPNFVETERTLP